MKDLLPPEATAAPPSRSPFRRTPRLAATLAAFLVLIGSPAVPAQEPKTPSASIQVTFLPPPLEHATYSLGIFDAKTNHLVRHLQEIASEKDFTVGLNGLITTWDGKDDDGKPVPPGRYAARGYAVGPLKVEGVGIVDNDWASSDESLRIKRILALTLVPANDDVAVMAAMADGSVQVMRFSQPGGELLWKGVPMLKPLKAAATDGQSPAQLITDGRLLYASLGGSGEAYSTEDGHAGYKNFNLRTSEPGTGANRTRWKIEDGTLVQSSDSAQPGEKLRELAADPDGLVPTDVAPSETDDRLYLLEEKPGWQRLRGLSWLETREENGRPVSTWKTFFERNIRQPEPSSLRAKPDPVEISLAENPLVPGKPQTIRLVAAFDARGSYLATGGGLRLRRVSERPNLQSAHLTRGKTSGTVSFFQSDGAATDEFSIGGVRDMMEFDGGEFELTATGEKPADTRAAEPPDL